MSWVLQEEQGLFRTRRFQAEGTASAKALRCEVIQSIWGELSNLVYLGTRNRSVCK